MDQTEIKNIRRRSKYKGVVVDGVIDIKHNGQDITVAFRAKDKGGPRTTEPYVFEWDNPEYEMGKVTLRQTVILDGGKEDKVGKVIEGGEIKEINNN